jgi:hypothetical protein
LPAASTDGFIASPKDKFNPLFTGNRRSFAEYRVSTRRIALKIPSSKNDYHLIKETPMNTLSTKLTAFAGALFANAVVMSAGGYCFALQSNVHLTALAFAKAVVAHQWLS